MLEWELISQDRFGFEKVFRMPIQGGWLVKSEHWVETTNQIGWFELKHENIVFIPDPEHEWAETLFSQPDNGGS